MPVSEAYAHVVMEGVWHADGKTKSQESLRDPENVEAAIAAEEDAGDGSPDEGGDGESDVGQVGHGEEDGRKSDSGVRGQEARQARHEIVLEKELLVDRPQNVATDVSEIGVVERVECASGARQEYCGDGKSCGNGKNPQRRNEGAKVESKEFRGRALPKNQD